MDARAVFEQYAKVSPEHVENHIYRIVSFKASYDHQTLSG